MKNLIDFIKDDPVESIKDIIAWGSWAGIIFMMFVVS